MSISGEENYYEQIKKSVFHSLDSDSDSETEANPELLRLSKDYDDGDKTEKPLSDIRKYNTPLLSEQNYKYRGEIACRESFDKYDNSNTNSSEYVSYSEDEIPHEDNKRNVSCIDDIASNGETTAKNTVLQLNQNSKFVFQKGVCVQNQLAIWEKLLEVRIHSQKILNGANNLPYPMEFQRLYSNKEFSESARETKRNLEVLLGKLIEAKFTLGMQYPEIKKLGLNKQLKTKKYTNSKEYESLNSSNFEKFKPYRNSILLKWEDRTSNLAPYRTAKTRGPAEKLSIVKNIDNHLIRLNDLISKTRTIKAYSKPLQRSVDTLKNQSTQQEISHVQVYDDTDFYHSQLRELIEYKTNTATNSYEFNTQCVELQKIRQKMKKKVDTRASKGRKIRYIVHNKLINFMGSKCCSNWTEESKSELYKSLFLT